MLTVAVTLLVIFCVVGFVVVCIAPVTPEEKKQEDIDQAEWLDNYAKNKKNLKK